MDERFEVPPDRIFSGEVLDRLAPAIEVAFAPGIEGMAAWRAGLASSDYDSPAQHAAVLLYSLAADLTYRAERSDPEAVTGHSLGIYGAAVGAGSISRVDAVRLVLTAGRAIQKAQDATGMVLLAVTGLPEPALQELIEHSGEPGRVAITHCNSTVQHLLSGPEKTMRELARAAIESDALGASVLAFPGVVHREVLAEFADEFLALVGEVRFGPPTTRFYSPVHGGLVTTADEARSTIRDQLTRPVLFSRTISRMVSAGIREFLVLGPCARLKAIIGWNTRETPVTVYPDAVREVLR